LSKRGALSVGISALVLLFAAGSGWSASSGATPKAAPKTVTVALITDFTGFLAPTAGWQGAETYFKTFNRHGGFHGVKINLKTFDGGSNPQTALQSAQRALSLHPAAIVSAAIFIYTALPTIGKTGIPAIGEGFTPGWGAGAKSLFSPIGDVSAHLSDVWLRVLKSQGSSKLALITGTIEKGDIELMDQDTGPLGLTTVLKDTSVANPMQSADALRVAQRINASGADGVLIFGTTGGIQVAVDLNQLGWKGHVLETSEVGQGVITQYGAKANGAIWAGHFASTYATKSAGVRQYRKDMLANGYSNEFTDNNPYAIVRYGQAKMLVEKGMTPCYPSFTKSCIVSNLSKLKNYTAGGIFPKTTFPLFQNSGPTCLSVIKIVNGKWVSLTNGTFPFLCGGPAKPIPTG
jgi:hypothetical protein